MLAKSGQELQKTITPKSGWLTHETHVIAAMFTAMLVVGCPITKNTTDGYFF
jgi:hypothetical protein